MTSAFKCLVDLHGSVLRTQFKAKSNLDLCHKKMKAPTYRVLTPALMTKHRCYQPGVKPHLIKALDHEAKLRGVPMTVVINDLLTKVLLSTQGMRLAREETLAAGESFPALPKPKK